MPVGDTPASQLRRPRVELRQQRDALRLNHLIEDTSGETREPTGGAMG
jgi:hypothetical protein